LETSLWCLGQAVAQAKLHAQAKKKRHKAQINHYQPLDVQSDMGGLVVRAPKFRESTGLPISGSKHNGDTENMFTVARQREHSAAS